jgi:hypothetical protein
MRYVVLLFGLLSTYDSIAQSTLTGLSGYILGRTTPDSLNQSEFSELEQAYVKGTIALPCAHIRTFKAVRAKVDVFEVNNLLLFFYDNHLFKISCDYSDALQRAFVQQHGQGKSQPNSRFTFCAQGSDKSMAIWGEVWQNGDIQALAVHAKGYNADCQPEETNQLVIKSQQLMDLASDCELPSLHPAVDEFDKAVNGR